MGQLDDIREGFRRMAEGVGPQQTMLATVKDVDAEDGTCTLLEEDDDGEMEYPGIRLRPVIDGTEALTLIPKVGAWCLAVRIEQDEEWMAIAFSEVDKWRLKIGTAVIEQDSTGLLISKGDDTLKQVLTLIIDSVKQIMVLYGNNPDFIKLAQAQTKVNNLLR